MSKLEFSYLPIDKIDISDLNVRKENLGEKIDELADSIKEIGIQQPVVVIKGEDDRYDLIIGQRRYLACKKLGKKEIPAIITTVKDDTEAAIKSFSENIHRLDLDYYDKMNIAQKLLEKLKSIEKVARHLGVSEQTVRNYLGYEAVPKKIKEMVSEKKLSSKTATLIAKSIQDEEKAIRIAEKIQETPRGEERLKLIDISRENQEKSVDEIVKIAKEQSKMKKVTINITQKLYKAIVFASQEYNSEKEDVVKIALEEWLTKRGFYK